MVMATVEFHSEVDKIDSFFDIVIGKFSMNKLDLHCIVGLEL